MLAEIGDGRSGRGTRRESDEPIPTGSPARPRTGTRTTGQRWNRRTARMAAAACASMLAVVSAAACSSSSNTGSSSGASPSSNATAPGAAQGAAQGADVAAAQAALAPYIGQSSAFPVTDPLASKLPAGKKFVYLQCSTPICAEVGGL